MSVIVLGDETLADVGGAARGECAIKGGAGSTEVNCLVSSHDMRRHKILDEHANVSRMIRRTDPMTDLPLGISGPP